MTVIVVGSVNMDAVVRVERLPGVGETIAGGDVAYVPGGKGANQAVAAARQGAPTRFVGCVGDDDAGRSLVAVLQAEGVDVDGVAVTADAPTGLAMIAVDGTGANTIVVAPGSNRCVTPAHVDAASFDGARAVVCQLEIPLETVARAFERGRAAGAVTVLNPSPARALDAALLALVDVVVANEQEAAHLSDVPGSVLVVTRGERGVVVHENGVTSEHRSFRVDAVDSTAAGDAFCGTLAAQLAAGCDVSGSVARAMAAGALAATQEGALPSLPTAAAVDALLTEARP